MKLQKSKDPFKKILVLVLSIVFVLALGVITYSATHTNTEDRSKAAETQVIYKSWEFSGTTSDGWVSTNLMGTKVVGGLLYARVAGTPTIKAALVNKSVSMTLPQGNKYIKLRLMVAPNAVPVRITVPEKPIVTKIPAPTTAPAPFTVSVSYTSKGATRTTQQIRGIADGKFYEYSVILPDIGVVAVNSIQFTFDSIKTATPIQIDYIRLVGSPLLTPTIVCKAGINSFSVDTSCTGGFRYMTFSCYDGFSRREGGSTSCKSSSVWNSYAQEYCKGRSNCSTTPGPTSIPVSITPHPATPTPTYTSYCKSNTDCPSGYICSAVPPWGCPTVIQNGVTVTSACATVPKCWATNPTPTPCGPVACAVLPSGCSYINSTSCSCGTLVCAATATITPTP